MYAPNRLVIRPCTLAFLCASLYESKYCESRQAVFIMGKKLKLSGYWMHVHNVFNWLGAQKGEFPKAVEIADDLWKVS